MFEKQVAASKDVNAWSGHACRQREGAENRNQITDKVKDRNGTEPEGEAGGRRQEGSRARMGGRGGERGQIEELELGGQACFTCESDAILSMTCTVELATILSGQVASHFNCYCYYLLNYHAHHCIMTPYDN